MRNAFRVLLQAVAVAALVGTPILAAASPMTNALEGEWSGAGTITLPNGKTERIRCKGDSRHVTENAIEQHFECASTAKKFNFSTSIRFQGGRAQGNFSAPDRSGTLEGRASPSEMSLHLASSDGTGDLAARLGACTQSLTVTGWSDNLKSLSVNLRKDC